jgi:hypothetical protein
MTKLDPKQRKAVYDVSTALASIAVVFGVISDDQASRIVAAVALLLSAGATLLARRHVPSCET